MRQKKGYTVFELVVYIALLALMLAVTSASALSVYRIFGVMRIERQITLEGDIAIETMIRDIRSATSTNVAESVFASNPGTLKIGSGVRFSLAGTTLQRNGVATQDLTAKARVTNLLFYRVDAPSVNSEIITIRMTLEAGNGFFERSRNFFGSAVPRGSY